MIDEPRTHEFCNDRPARLQIYLTNLKISTGLRLSGGIALFMLMGIDGIDARDPQTAPALLYYMSSAGEWHAGFFIGVHRTSLSWPPYSDETLTSVPFVSRFFQLF